MLDIHVAHSEPWLFVALQSEFSITMQWRIQHFSEAGRQLSGDAYLLFGIIFAENCMEMKKN